MPQNKRKNMNVKFVIKDLKILEHLVGIVVTIIGVKTLFSIRKSQSEKKDLLREKHFN